MLPKFFSVFAAVSGMIAVMLGAFAAHGLKNKLDERLLVAFQTGVQYQFIHTLALLLVVVIASLPKTESTNWLSAAAMAFVAGILLFSGSLYALALTGIKWFGPITPLGGFVFILGWAFLILHFVKQ